MKTFPDVIILKKINIQGLVLSCAPGPWSAEQCVEHALGHHPLPRDLGWPGAGHQEAAEDVAVLLSPFCIQILKSGNILHLLEGKRHSSINPCMIKYQNIKFIQIFPLLSSSSLSKTKYFPPLLSSFFFHCVNQLKLYTFDKLSSPIFCCLSDVRHWCHPYTDSVPTSRVTHSILGLVQPTFNVQAHYWPDLTLPGVCNPGHRALGHLQHVVDKAHL